MCIEQKDIDRLHKVMEKNEGKLDALVEKLNEHVLWEEKYQGEFRTNLALIKDQTTRTNGTVKMHEERHDKMDVWKAGYVAQARGLWLAVLGLGTILGIIARLIGLM